MYLEEAVNQQKKELQDMMFLAKEAHAELETRRKLLDDRKTAFENETKTAKADINKMADTLIQIIQQRGRDTTKELEKQARTHIDAIASQKLIILAKQKQIEDCLQFGKEILDQACNSDVMELNGVLKERLQDLNERRQSAQPSIKLLHISYIRNNSLLAVVKQLGTLQTLCIDPLRCKAQGMGENKAFVGKQSHFVVTTGNEDRKKSTHVHADRVTVSIRSLDGKPDIIPEVNAKGNGTYRVSYTPVLLGKYIESTSGLMKKKLLEIHLIYQSQVSKALQIC